MLPGKLAEIRENLTLHTKSMTADDIESAVIKGPGSIGWKFPYRFALLVDDLFEDIVEWRTLAKTCDNINLFALAELEEVCGKQASDFLIHWKREKTDKATSQRDQSNKYALGLTLMRRGRAICFFAMEEKLFQPPPPAPLPTHLSTKTVSSGLPVTLTIPANFNDETRRIYEGLPSLQDVSVYCSPEDAALMRDQMLGKRETDKVETGCFFVQLDKSTTYDVATKSFSVEKYVEEIRKSPPSSGAPRFEMTILSFEKRQIQGVPTLAFLQAVTGGSGKDRIHFLYATHGADVWLVRYIPGKQEDLGAAIWAAFVTGL